MSAADTIAAIVTAPGRAAVGILRVSGPRVPDIALAILGRVPAPRHAELATFRAADATALDHGIALYFPAPDSFTGEAVLELQGHGGTVVLDELLRRLFELGCRGARPGEFSERAYLNGKLDLAQAEAIADLIDAGTADAARAAVRSLRGEFSAAVDTLQAQLTALRALVEAAIDFPDEDIEFLERGAIADRLVELRRGLETLAHLARQGALLREGLTVVIAGKPNAGKSSLMNRLAGTEVAIVTAIPGTTRDVLRERVQLDGIPLHLVDTAGLRSATDPIEAEGVRRAWQEVGAADHLIYVVDATLTSSLDEALREELAQLPAAIPLTVVFNKVDALPELPGGPPASPAGPPLIYLSARTGYGIEALRAQLLRAAGAVAPEAGSFSARRRHLDALARARQHVEDALRVLEARRAAELLAEELRLAQRALGEITGEFTSEDLLGTIFGSFCIGK